MNGGWIELHVGTPDHPKVRKLARRLSVSEPTALGHLAAFWLGAATYAEDGDLSVHDAEDIAIWSKWDGDPNAFLAALRECQFLDGSAIHNWTKYAAGLLASREAGRKGNHERWHVQRGISAPDCAYCSPTRIGGDIGGESLAISGANPPTNQPTKPTALSVGGESGAIKHPCPSCGSSTVEAVKSRAENAPRWKCRNPQCKGGGSGRSWASFEAEPPSNQGDVWDGFDSDPFVVCEKCKRPVSESTLETHACEESA